MRLLEFFRLAWSILWANRLRTFLTILGNVVAVGSVVAVVAIINGLNSYVSERILSTGSGVFSVTKYGFTTNHEEWMKMLRRKDLTVDDATYLAEHMTHAATVVPIASRPTTLRFLRDEARNARVVGLGEGYPDLRTMELASGRHLVREDVQGRSNAVVLGDQVREKLFGSIDPVGRTIHVGRHTFHVVGVLKKRGSVLGQSQDNIVLIPISTYVKLFDPRDMTEINIRAKDVTMMIEAQEEAELLLKLRRGLNPWDDPDFSIATSEMFYQLYKNLTNGIYGLTIGIVAISLLVGGIVIMNIMFVSVTERTREIGIRRALGARRRDIILQFLSESVMLAAFGGVVGVLVGVAGALILRAATPLPASVEFWSVALGLLLASTVGLFFGIQPAFRASRLVPMEALRYEV